MAFHSYLSLDSDASIHTLMDDERMEAEKEFVQCVEARADISSHLYATLGLKTQSRILLHMEGESPVIIQTLVRDLMHTTLGRHLRITYTLSGITRSSQYNPHHAPKESAPETPHQYLVVYPFTKTIEWHLLPYDQRRAIMKDHVDVGRKFSASISQLLLYAYGIDDHEFIVSYQMNSIEEFQTLVMELRSTEARRHTKHDTPIFTCIHMPFKDALAML